MLQQFKTMGGVQIELDQKPIDYQKGIEPLIEQLNAHRGALFSSGFEYPGRYTCWDIGFYNPPLVLTCRGLFIQLTALNCRGEIILGILRTLIKLEQVP